MNLEKLNRKVSWTVLLLAALIVIPAAQQYRINLAQHSEQAASRMLARYAIENVELRMKLARRGN